MIKVTIEGYDDTVTIRIVDKVDYFGDSGGVVLDRIAYTNGILSRVEREFISFDEIKMISMSCASGGSQYDNE